MFAKLISQLSTKDQLSACMLKDVTHGQLVILYLWHLIFGLQAGEALTISYIDLELPRSARQLELKTCFFFDCKCIR